MTARRYLLGRQGLWPGRRWQGKEGVASAITQIEAVQIDPLVVVARNHDLVLWSRVVGYDPDHLNSLLYTDRFFFDYGSILMIFPMQELPYWRPLMRQKATLPYYTRIDREHGEAIAHVRAALRERGPLGNRDFAGTAKVETYRSTKDTGLALYYLWMTGELMTHSRRKFERLYGFSEEIVPPHLSHEATLEEAEDYFSRKALNDVGLGTTRVWANRVSTTLRQRINPKETKKRLEKMVADGIAATVEVEGSRETWYVPAQDATILETLNAGGTPDAWRPLGPATHEAVTFLAPLDNVIWDRARTQTVFDFDYIWEVYKPAAQRRWGYYTLPILYGDRLVARIDPRFERKTNTLTLCGFWLDDPALADDPSFAVALANGLRHFAAFLGATRLDLSPLPPNLRHESLAELASV